MSRFQVEDVSDEQLAREEALYGPFTEAVRELVDATIRTEVEPDEVRAAQVEIEAITERLRRRQMPGAFGVRFRADGSRGRNWGNAVMGLRNPVAPPLQVESDGTGRAWSDFRLGAAYEGPPGLVHGGVVALVLDQVLGHAVSTSGLPGMTGTLTVVYRQGTPLGDLRCEAWVDRREGIKTWGRGRMVTAGGEVSAEADGVFILPRWARERLARLEAEQDGDGVPGFFE